MFFKDHIERTERQNSCTKAYYFYSTNGSSVYDFLQNNFANHLQRWGNRIIRQKQSKYDSRNMSLLPGWWCQRWCSSIHVRWVTVKIENKDYEEKGKYWNSYPLMFDLVGEPGSPVSRNVLPSVDSRILLESIFSDKPTFLSLSGSSSWIGLGLMFGQ